MTHLTQISHVVMTQIIDGLQFETRPYPLRNFRVAKSTSFLFSIVRCTLRFTHMQSLIDYSLLLAGNEISILWIKSPIEPDSQSLRFNQFIACMTLPLMFLSEDSEKQPLNEFCLFKFSSLTLSLKQGQLINIPDLLQSLLAVSQVCRKLSL